MGSARYTLESVMLLFEETLLRERPESETYTQSLDLMSFVIYQNVLSDGMLQPSPVQRSVLQLERCALFERQLSQQCMPMHWMWRSLMLKCRHLWLPGSRSLAWSLICYGATCFQK
jgi:hypothetical protein